MLLWAVLDYREESVAVDKLEYDMEIVTVGDYTLEMHLRKEH